MQPPKSRNQTNPNPISQSDLEAILKASEKHPRHYAAWLLMLNCALYPSEAVALNWGEIDLDKKTLVTDRGKTTVVRIAVLWDRTVDALEKIKPADASEATPVFMSRRGTRLSVATLRENFRDTRKAAAVSAKVKGESLRDGAQTAAIEGGAAHETVKLLAGHSTGISDFYVRRKPSMVADACREIERYYFS